MLRLKPFYFKQHNQHNFFSQRTCEFSEFVVDQCIDHQPILIASKADSLHRDEWCDCYEIVDN